jgi:RNA polymerase sigma-70 factor (ECF subfamily)
MSHDEHIGDLYRRGADAWPGVRVDPVRFAELVADKVSGEAPDIAALNPADLYLACACAAGERAAIAAFESRYMTALPASLARLQLTAAELDEVMQIVREKLLVGSAERAPRIRDMAGRGDLGALVRVAALRTALNLRRGARRRPEESGEDLVDLLAGEVDPARSIIESQERAALKSAFEEALARLEPRQRNLLRLHLRHRLGIDEIGRLHRVHRATAARWLERIRDQLRRDTGRFLAQRTGRELDSLRLLVDSRLDISFERLLGTQS